MRSARRVKTLWVREPYLNQILTRRKTVEVRVGYDNINRLRPGDRLWLNDRHLAKIHRIGRYANFEELVAHEDPAAIAPDLSPDTLLPALRDIYPTEREALGVVALGVVALEVCMLPYDAVLFDMGSTLVTFEPPQELINQQALLSAGVERTQDEIGAAVNAVWGAYYRDAATKSFPPTEEYDRQSQIDLARSLLNQLGAPTDEQTLCRYTDALENWFSRPGVVHPFPEVEEVLTSLQVGGYRLGIVSNWSWNLRERVAQVALDGFFEMVWASAYAGCNKPNPTIFEQALTQMDIAPDRAVYVGDSFEHDVLGARNAGIDIVLLDRKGTVNEPGCPIIGDLRDLLTLLEG